MFLRNVSFLLSFILAMGLASSAQAHFFAYQKWHNPATGQILEEYYDNHGTTNPNISLIAQQEDFIHQAKQRNNILVLVEDSNSFFNRKALHFDPARENKTYIRKCTQDIPPQKSPLLWLYAHCFIHEIAAVNIECRPNSFDDDLAPEYAKEIALYDDNAILNKFYNALHTHAKEQVILEKDSTLGENFNYQCLVLDARALHAIANNPDKHIMLAAGYSHIISINNVLLQLGWVPITITVAEGFNPIQKEALLNAMYKVESRDNHAQLVFEFEHDLSIHLDALRAHALDISSIGLDTRSKKSPQPSHDLLLKNHVVGLVKTLVAFEQSLWGL